MTPAETARTLQQVTRHWDRFPQPADAIDVWQAALVEFDAEAVAAALGRLSTREFPPNASQVAAEIRRGAQGPVPGFDEMLGAVWRALPLRVFIKRLYSPTGQYPPSATAEAVAVMLAGGAHEAACRFVQSIGLGALCKLPDGTLQGLDVGQEADRRDMSRHYRDAVLPDWSRDPRAGVALERACQAAGLDPVDTLELAEQTRRTLAPAPRPALPRAAEPLAEDDGATVDPDELMRQWRADRARAASRQREELKARMEGDRAEQRATLAELAEHKAAAR